MKNTIRSGVYAVCLALGGNVFGAETIRYYGGQNLVANMENRVELDLDFDGESDFGFEALPPVCLWEMPPRCVFTVTTIPHAGTRALETNSFLAAVPAGALIGSQPVSGALWSTNALTAAAQSTRGVEIGVPIQQLGEAYCGFQFTAEDGVHFGWMRIRVTVAPVFQTPYLDFDPVVILPGDSAVTQTHEAQLVFVPFYGPTVSILEWAYETRPNTPIAAGALPAAMAVGVGLGSRSGHFRLAWESDYGAAYYVQHKDAISATTWVTPVLRVVATGSFAAAEIETAGVTRFFRVIRAD